MAAPRWKVKPGPCTKRQAIRAAHRAQPDEIGAAFRDWSEQVEGQDYVTLMVAFRAGWDECLRRVLEGRK